MRSMIEGNVLKQIILFAIPLMIGNVFQQFYALADMFIVGRFLGIDSLAAVGAMIPIFVMIVLMTAGYTRGLVILTAQRFGAGDETGVRHSFATGLFLSGFFAVLMVAILVVTLPTLLVQMQVPENIYDLSLGYMTVLSYSLFATVFYNYLSGVMQSLGDSKTPLYFLIFSCFINVLFNVLLIVGMGMDVRGAALGTGLAQGVSVILCFAYMMWRFPILRIGRADWYLSRPAIWTHLRMAVPLGLQFSIIGLGMIVTQWACNAFGSDVIAAFSAASRLEHLVTIPLFTLGMAITTFAAQNFGAGQINRIRQGVRQCALLSLGLSLIAAAFVFVWGMDIVMMFIKSPTAEVVDAARTYLYVTVLFYFFQGQIFVFRQTLSGMGYVVLPFAAGLTELIMRGFAAFVLVAVWGYIGVCLSGPVSWIGGALVAGMGYFYFILKCQNRLKNT